MQEYTFEWPNGQICNLRQFPYNSKKQCQTEYSVASATPIAGVFLKTFPEGTLVKLNEQSSDANFYVSKHDYESTSNGEGKTLLTRKDCYSTTAFNSDSSKGNIYTSSTIDTSLENDYFLSLPEKTKSKIVPVKIVYTPSSSGGVSQVERKVFALSIYELGTLSGSFNQEGEVLPISDILIHVYFNSEKVGQWTRTPARYPNNVSWVVDANGTPSWYTVNFVFGLRPNFCFSSDTLFNSVPNEDGSYSLL